PLEVLADRAAAEVDTPADGHLVFSRTYFKSWLATLDGNPAPVLVANARDLAIAVPAGRHRVAFAWNRGAFHRGVALRAAGLLPVAAALVGARRRGGGTWTSSCRTGPRSPESCAKGLCGS